MSRWRFSSVAATEKERSEAREGDHLVPLAVVVMDRGFSLAEPPAVVWPWIEQLGKRRGGWYLPRSVERVIPSRRRARGPAEHARLPLSARSSTYSRSRAWRPAWPSDWRSARNSAGGTGRRIGAGVAGLG